MDRAFIPLLYVIALRLNLGSHPVSQTNPAILVLADGTVFRGVAIGASGSSAGEVVFNTAMTGYQEILTDPSYCKQIVTLTCPHIGNVGVNTEDVESRQLTRILREKGAQNGCIATGTDETAALAAARGFAGRAGMDLAREVSCAQPYSWTQREWELGVGYPEAAHTKFHVVAYDFGVKRNILRMLAERGCRITVVPAQTTAKEVLAMEPDGVLLSNGPGDPEPCDYAIDATRQFIAAGVPLFGICLGHQIMGLAVGAKTEKMKFGHR